MWQSSFRTGILSLVVALSTFAVPAVAQDKWPARVIHWKGPFPAC